MRNRAVDQTVKPEQPGELTTLAIDIGGSHLKAGVLTSAGTMTGTPQRVVTPRPSTPAAVVDALTAMARRLGSFDRISVGFPGVVRHGLVMTAPNLDTQVWHEFPLASTLAERLGKPARLANDATVQGLGVITGKGVECVITLGTGMGFALYEEGRPGPHLELSQLPVRRDKTYDQYVGYAALRACGRKRWNRRVERAIGYIQTLTGYDALYIGGGNAKYIAFKLSPGTKVVSNEAGITGGVRLWDASAAEISAPG